MINQEAKRFVEWLKEQKGPFLRPDGEPYTVEQLYHWSQEQAGKCDCAWGTFSEEDYTKALLMGAEAARFSESPLN